MSGSNGSPKPPQFQPGPGGNMVFPPTLQNIFNQARDYAAQIRQNLPAREAVVAQTKEYLDQRVNQSIDTMATTPSLGDVVDRYDVKPPTSPLQVPSLIGGTVTSGARIALSGADGINQLRGGEAGQIQERFRENAMNAKENAKTQVPMAYNRFWQSYEVARAHGSYNPLRGLNIMNQQQMQGVAQVAVTGGNLHQTPLFPSSVPRNE